MAGPKARLPRCRGACPLKIPARLLRRKDRWAERPLKQVRGDHGGFAARAIFEKSARNSTQVPGNRLRQRTEACNFWVGLVFFPTARVGRPNQPHSAPKTVKLECAYIDCSAESHVSLQCTRAARKKTNFEFEWVFASRDLLPREPPRISASFVLTKTNHARSGFSCRPPSMGPQEALHRESLRENAADETDQSGQVFRKSANKNAI